MSDMIKSVAIDRADWLLDAIACATQDRRFLRGDAAYDEEIGGVILINAQKAIATAIDRFTEAAHTFPLGTRVTKLRGSSWTGRVCGHYTPTNGIEGVIVESENEPGSCQLYPNSAMRAMGDDE